MHRAILISILLVFVVLTARSLVDKLLAYSAGPELVAHWAQLQSVFDLIVGVTMTGVGQGVTVYAARSDKAQQAPLINEGLVWGLSLSGLMAITLLSVMPWVNAQLHRELLPEFAYLAALAGWFSVVPCVFLAYWQGKQQRGRMLLFSLLSWLPLLICASGVWGKPNHLNLLLTQLISQLVLALYCLRQHQGDWRWRLDNTRLKRYLIAGLSIGILSPGSLLWSRAQLAHDFSWHDVAQLHALWRASDWITSLASVSLSLLFLPKLATLKGYHFYQALQSAWRWVFLPVVCSIWLLWYYFSQILGWLYDERFIMPSSASALFLSGDVLRVASWIPLFALFASERVKAIAIGEWFSLPLFASLLTFTPIHSLYAAGICYVGAYLIYLMFNLVCVYRFRQV